ncbi:MAG: FAD-dependent oxidoreductase [Bacteroidetes bacterium]|nr:FAD-dependent oxidoreductase [Bacteroidota bacterium]
MDSENSKYIIIGAGLSGLCAGYMLHKAGESNFMILEARKRLGGRIFTKNGIDFGATWFQEHHRNVGALLEELGIPLFHQFTEGKSILVYSTMAPAHYFETDQSVPSAKRVGGSTSEVIRRLAAPISEKIKLQTHVYEIAKNDEGVMVSTSEGTFQAQKVIVTIPPRLAAVLEFHPPLPETLLTAMQTTHTWMSNAIKVGLTFTHPFWKEKGLSGTLIGQGGAVTELYDHTCNEGKTFSLMGFVNEGLRELTPKQRKERVLAYMANYLGEEVHDYLSFEEMDWSQDQYTSCSKLHSVYISPQYGKPELSEVYMANRLILAGAETAAVYGGYMDGAIHSAILAVQKLLSKEE